MKKPGFSFEKPHRGQSDTWLTPPHIYKSLGDFDLDPCGHESNKTAKKLIVLPNCGLKSEWFGRIWLNPPYGPATKIWLDKMEKHNFGTALVLSRTDTKWFHKACKKAKALLFLEGRINHLKPGMVEYSKNSSATCGSVLIAFGNFDAKKLLDCELKGLKIKL